MQSARDSRSCKAGQCSPGSDKSSLHGYREPVLNEPVIDEFDSGSEPDHDSYFEDNDETETDSDPEACSQPSTTR